MTTPHVADGVFFRAPADLPRGRHDLAHEQIQTAQRERLMAAVTELMAHRGYRGVGVRDIAKQAKVSLSAFYDCYADKDECFFAAYDRFIAVLLERISAALEEGDSWETRLTNVVRSYLEAMDADPVVARAFQVEMDALGRPARERRRQALRGIAMALKSSREQIWTDHPTVPESAYVGVVYAVRQLASDALDAGSGGPLIDMVDEISPWVTASLGATQPTHTSNR